MKYVKRTLWIAAWSGWVCAGVGLYRELPRDLGEPVRTLPIDGPMEILGFLGASNEVAVFSRRAESPSEVKVFDAETGACVGSVLGPKSAFVPINVGRNRSSVRFADAIRVPENSTPRYGLFALDLTTGEWRRVSQHEPHGSVSIHSRKPWVAFATRTDRGEVAQAIVADYRTGLEVFAHALATTASRLRSAFLLPESDKLVVVVSGEDKATSLVEIWNLADAPVLEKRLSGVTLGRVTDATSDGLIACRSAVNTADVDVYDLVAERYLYSTPPLADRNPDREFHSGVALVGFVEPTLSIDSKGRRFFGGWDRRIVDLDTGSVVWTARPTEWMQWTCGEGLFCSEETWSTLWNQWLPSRSYGTSAVRDMTGRLVVRTTSFAGLNSIGWNAARTLAVEPEGRVFRLPHRVDYPLLALCQAILAAPLMLIWVWSRRRRRPTTVRSPSLLTGSMSH